MDKSITARLRKTSAKYVGSLPVQDIKAALQAIICLKDLTIESGLDGLPMNSGTTSIERCVHAGGAAVGADRRRWDLGRNTGALC